MADLVKIVIEGQDKSGVAFDSVLKNSKKTTSEVKGLGIAFSQAANLANQLGATSFAGVIGSIDNAVFSVSSLTKELGKSKLAMTGLSLGAVGLGYSIGEQVRKWIPFFNEVDKLEAGNVVSKRSGQVQLETLGIQRPELGAMRSKIAGINDEISAQGKNPTQQQLELIEQLERQKQVIKDKYESDDTKRAQEGLKRQLAYGMELSEYEDHWNTMRLEASNWGAEQRRLIEEEEDQRSVDLGNRKVELAKVVALRIAKINQEQAEETYQRTTALYKRQLNSVADYTGGTAQLLGQLSNLAAQGGKKQFKLAQALRYGEAVMSTASGVARAFADYAWPYCLIPAAIAAATGATQIATISSQKAPQAHGGLDFVPEESTFLLSRGERVIQPDQNVKLTEFLDGKGGGGQMVSVTVNLDSYPLFKAMDRASRDGRLVLSSKAIV